MSPVRWRQIGLVLAGLGSLFFVWGSGLILRAERSYGGPTEGQHRTEKLTHFVGGCLLAAGFSLQLVSLVV